MNDPIAAILREAGEHLLAIRARGTTWRRDGMVYTSAADRQAHEFLARRLSGCNPYVPIISEEDPGSLVAVRPHSYWLVDPIDGTGSFVEGYPGFVAQVALMDERGPLAAWVYAPATDELFTAHRGLGAAKNGRPLRIDQQQPPDGVIDNYPEPRGVAAAAAQALGLGRYVESGSIGLKICRIADGTAHLFVKDVVVREWDLAPAHLVLAEAGGSLTDVDGAAVEYGGGFERRGVVAAQNHDLLVRFHAWRNR